MEYLLDLRDYRCPLPLLMAKKALSQLAPEDSLQLLLASTADFQDLIEQAQSNGCRLQQKQQNATELQLVFVKNDAPFLPLEGDL